MYRFVKKDSQICQFFKNLKSMKELLKNPHLHFPQNLRWQKVASVQVEELSERKRYTLKHFFQNFKISSKVRTIFDFFWYTF